MTKAEVRAQWGRTHGVCRSCARTTWYFNLKPFEPQGAGVELRRGRVARVFTVWRPLGWRTAGGLALGVRLPELRAAIPALKVRPCESYTAYLAPSGTATDERLLRLPRPAVGLRPHEARALSLSLSRSSSARRVTRGSTARIGIATAGQTIA